MRENVSVGECSFSTRRCYGTVDNSLDDDRGERREERIRSCGQRGGEGRGGSQVCKHSVTVCASRRYPMHKEHIKCSFMIFVGNTTSLPSSLASSVSPILASALFIVGFQKLARGGRRTPQ
jgi:hypothetical protein